MLTDIEVRRLQPAERPYKRADALGLHLLVKPNGAKLWRMRYVLHGKEQLLSFGPYPEVQISAARRARDDARHAIRSGRNPAVEKKIRGAMAANPENRFKAVALDWHQRQKVRWTARHADDVLDSLQRLIFPKIGNLLMGEITAPLILATLRPVETRAAETAHRLRQRISAVFCHGIACGMVETDPAAVIGRALRPVRRGKQPAITDLVEARAMLGVVEANPSHVVTRWAMRLLALTAVRPGEIANARWSEIDGDVWTIPAERMKMRVEHVVPLSCQALDLLSAIRDITGSGSLLFPNTRFATRPMSENALSYLMIRSGYSGRHVPHGWRATFSTVMNEHFSADRAVIDLMLAHAPERKTEAAYNRSERLQRRHELAQLWADLLLTDALPPRSLLATRQR